MRTRPALVAGAALGVLAASAFGADAQTKTPRHRHAHAEAVSGEVVELRQEVQELKSEVHLLEGRLDSQAQAQQQTQAQAQSAQTEAQNAQTQAQAAQAQAQSAQSQIETIPTQVAAQVVKDRPKPGWEANTTLGATIFADVSNINNRADGVPTPQSGTDFDIKRLYLQVDHRFNDVFSANATTDFVYDSGTSATQLIIKKAYLQAKLSDALIFRAGAADLPWVPFVEKLYGYRYVENVLIDRTKFGTSTDWGLHALGSLAGGIINYQISVIDGSGYKKPAIGNTNRTDAVDVEGRVSATYDHFTLAVGGYEGKLGKDVTGTPTFNTAQRFDLLAVYANDRFRIGGEYFWAKDWNDVTQANPAKTNVSDGYSVFGSFNFTPKIAAFGRYDYVKPQRTTAPTFNDNFFNVGLSYSPIKPLDFALVYKRDTVNNGLFTTADGVIGGVHTGTYDEIGVYTQVKF